MARRPCTHDCNQGRTCPHRVRRSTDATRPVLIAVFLLTALILLAERLLSWGLS